MQHANNKLVSVNLIETPDTSASILVAIPSPIRQRKPIQAACSFSCSKASSINFVPKMKNIPKTIHLLNGTKKLYNLFVPR